MPELRKQADVVIVLGHLGVREDIKLAKHVQGIDMILGGHSHARLTQPILVQNGDASAFSLEATPIVQAYKWGSEMGRTDVVFHRDLATGYYTLMSCCGKLISINKSIPDNPQIDTIIRKYRTKTCTNAAKGKQNAGSVRPVLKTT